MYCDTLARHQLRFWARAGEFSLQGTTKGSMNSPVGSHAATKIRPVNSYAPWTETLGLLFVCCGLSIAHEVCSSIHCWLIQWLVFLGCKQLEPILALIQSCRF